ncbi:MAG: hypothetical protein J6P87_01050 [Lachnospiraceae bacterium]|nr:hypothetical protein [Lachnospiraceae bacterium]
MFGYIIVNPKELKLKEYEIYRAYYCGLCEALKDRHGRFGQMTLSYDSTFLTLLLSGLYETDELDTQQRCLIHPLRKHRSIRTGFTDYAADMTIMLSYYSSLDDWSDEHKLRKLVLSRLLGRREKKLEAGLRQKADLMTGYLKELHGYETSNEENIDLPSGAFGNLLSEVFAVYEDEWAAALRHIGFYLGKFIYIMDAYDDLSADEKSGSYNPLLPRINEPDFDDRIKDILTLMMSECAQTFETLPVLRHLEVLRNILYSGVWTRYNAARQKREESKSK